jgi:uncharacterized protein YciI
MLVALIAHDKPGALDVRKANRAAHLEHLNASDIVRQAGPLLDGEGQMIGSLIILEVEDMAAAQDFADRDPYGKAGLFEDITLTHWNRVIG